MKSYKFGCSLIFLKPVPHKLSRLSNSNPESFIVSVLADDYEIIDFI